MTAAVMPDTFAEWAGTVTAAWIVLSCLGGFSFSFVASRLRKLRPAPAPVESDATWLLPELVEPSSWTYIPVDLPSVPLSWAEQEALNAIERREFSGGAAA